MNRHINVRVLRIMPYSILIKAVLSAVLPVGLLAEFLVVRQNGGHAAGLAPMLVGMDTACIIVFAMLAICLMSLRGLSRRYEIATALLVLCIVMFSALLMLTMTSKYFSGLEIKYGQGQIDTLIAGMGISKEVVYYLAVMFVMTGTAEALESYGDCRLAPVCRKTGISFAAVNAAAKLLAMTVFHGGPAMMEWAELLRSVLLTLSEIAVYIILNKAVFVLWRSLTVRAGRGFLHGK